MEIQTLKKSHKKQIIIGALAICIVGGALTFATSKAKYKLTQDTPLVRGTVNYKLPDLKTVALYTENDSGDYVEANNVPTSGYQLNTEKSMCKVYDGTTSIENAPKDNNATIEYKNGSVTFANITKKNTRCYLYFDTIKDTEKPTISNVATTVTKTEINVTVTATDNEGVTEYYYQLNSNTPLKGTGNTHKFTGLSAGTTYSVKVYVKDAAGNQSDTTTKEITTTPNTASETILASITVKTGTPDFSKVATTDEGVFKVADGMYGGYSYYWRGAVTNNYVKFANFCWRIVRINGDGSIRLIYDGTTCHQNGQTTSNSIAKASVGYNSTYNQPNYVGWTYSGTSQRTTGGTASNAKTQLESWYSSNITGTNASKVAQGKYCNDRDVTSGYTYSIYASYFAYATSTRGNPTLSCPTGDVYTLNVGLITVDEIKYAGFSGTDNKLYYLYNGQDYWTMSPTQWDSGGASVSYLRSNGYLIGDYVYTAHGLRPVINLRSDIPFSSGNGTQSSPYVVS